MSTALIKTTIEHDGRAWDLWKTRGGEAPLARDLDFAAWLGFDRPHEIRRLAERHSSSLGRVFVTVTKSHGRPGRTSYYTRRQCLILAAKSETPRALEVLESMVQVFEMAMDGRVGHADFAVLEELAALRQQVKLLAGRQEQEQVIGDGLARSILLRVQGVAAFRACVHRGRSLASLRSAEEQEIRVTVGLAPDVPWRLLSVYVYPRALEELHRRERRARKDAEAADGDRQADLLR